MALVFSRIFYAFGGMLEAGRIGSATNNLGFMYELVPLRPALSVACPLPAESVRYWGTGIIIFTVIN